MTTRVICFGRLLKAGISSIANCEGKTAPVIEADLGERIGVAGYTIQRYKAGNLPPEPRTIYLLAEACVRRGYLNRDWLQAFLHAARHPTPDQLLDQLCPIKPTRTQPPRVYHNLAAPTYTQFIMREHFYNEILDSLRQRTPVVLIVGMGGMGKTSLAHEIATRCLDNATPELCFDAAIWISDKDHPGTTNLSVVLNEIARVLDYPGFMQLAYDDRRLEVEQLLRRQRILLIIDNFETITDDALPHWLLRLPEPSKAIITTREHHQEFRHNGSIDLSGMTHNEAQKLIGERLRALKLARFLDNPAQLDPLIATTGGNPKAIELAIGLMKYEHRPLPCILKDLNAACGSLFDDLFSRSWNLLDAEAQRILLALVLFPSSASHTALSTAAHVHELAFDQALELLTDLSLVSTQPTDLQSHPRYTLHSLVRAFARGKRTAHPQIDNDTREHWLQWALHLAAQVGFCWSDLQRLNLLDTEHANLYEAIQWAFQNQRYAETIALVEGIRYYYNVRGIWDERLTINLLRAEAAHQISDHTNEALALAHHIEIRSKQGYLDEATDYRKRLETLAAATPIPNEALFEIRHAQALHERACGNLAAAEEIWWHLLELSARLGGQKYVINRRWLATCRYQRGALEEARHLYEESLQDAMSIEDIRSIVGNILKLAAIDLDQGHTERAVATLETHRATIEHLQDRRRLAELQRLRARCFQTQGKLDAAYNTLLIVIDLFDRLGMRRERDEAKEALMYVGEICGIVIDTSIESGAQKQAPCGACIS